MEPKPHFQFSEFTIQKLCDSIGVPEDEILNCYLCGSRVYGTHNEDSDWDFVSVVDDGFFAKYPEKSNLIDDHFISSGLFEKERWKKMLIEHNPVAVVAHYTPKQFVLKETCSFPFQLDLASLKFAWLRKSSSCFNRARNVYYPATDYKRMKKMIVHSYRYLLLAKQLLDQPDALSLDFSCANEIYAEMMEETSVAWDYYEAKYGPRREELSFQAFPKDLVLNDFIDKDCNNVPLAKLQRNLQFPGTFEGQSKYQLLDIIRYDMMKSDEVLEVVPTLYSLYLRIEENYTNMMDTIQKLYDDVKLEHLANWYDPTHSREMAANITAACKKYTQSVANRTNETSASYSSDTSHVSTLLFYMWNKQIDCAREIFRNDDKLKLLTDTLFRGWKD